MTTEAAVVVCFMCQHGDHWDCAADDAEVRCDCQHPSIVVDLDSLTRALRRIRDARSRIAEIRATGQRELDRLRADMDRVEAWMDAETTRDRREEAWWTAQAAAHLAQQIAQRPKGPKSISTPYGVVSSRSQGPAFERDEEVLLRWAEEHGFVSRREVVKVDWAAIRAATSMHPGGVLVTQAGEVVEGVTAHPQEPRVTVEVPE